MGEAQPQAKLLESVERILDGIGVAEDTRGLVDEILVMRDEIQVRDGLREALVVGEPVANVAKLVRERLGVDGLDRSSKRPPRARDSLIGRSKQPR